MDGLTISHVYEVLVFVACAMGIYNIIHNYNRQHEQNGVTDGAMSTDISYIKSSLKSIETSIDKLDEKLERRYSDLEHEFRDVLISNNTLEQNYKSLHKRVDELSETIKAMRGND